MKALFRPLLLKWYRKSARDLPWRRTRDPYRVIVSEFMLQQTQVSRVEEYYPKFLARYPTVQHLARARPKKVRETWEGLGYYARARNLHALARTVVKDHDSAIPSDTETLQTLPGVGRYTAGAVACFAFEKREAAVDTNVKRVVERVFRTKNVWEATERILPRRGKTVWEFNQALMDLGATICVARKPKCPVCPVRSACKTGLKERRPRKRQ
ncbi:MAG: A/G-specific adenine glycosylase [Gemmatimonadetes bacterium]|nr:A/G-specific adenine glycosylase [Gemmatimonadota bacterium]